MTEGDFFDSAKTTWSDGRTNSHFLRKELVLQARRNVLTSGFHSRKFGFTAIGSYYAPDYLSVSVILCAMLAGCDF